MSDSFNEFVEHDLMNNVCDILWTRNSFVSEKRKRLSALSELPICETGEVNQFMLLSVEDASLIHLDRGLYHVSD